MKVHTYVPASINVGAAEDGNRLLVASFADGEQIVIVIAPEAAKEVGRMLTSPTVQTFSDSDLGGLGLKL